MLVPEMRHIIHCSGYNIAERNKSVEAKNRAGRRIAGKYFDWDHVCIGNPSNGELGRITMTLHLAERFRPEAIIWSTGATFAAGISEAQAMLDAAINYWHEQSAQAHWLKSISIVEEDGANTLTSMEEAAKIFRDRFGLDEIMLHLVTSSNHAPRVARDAAIAFANMRHVLLSVTPAHTSYGAKSPANVEIQELG
jgi:hypothetical protein